MIALRQLEIAALDGRLDRRDGNRTNRDESGTTNVNRALIATRLGRVESEHGDLRPAAR